MPSQSNNLKLRLAGLSWRAERLFLPLAFCVIGFACTGCSEKKVFAQPSFDADSRPLIPARPTASPDSNDDAPPDIEIAELTEFFKQHTISDQGYRLLVEPNVVLEVAFNNVMISDRHESGYALRFPRINRIRWDKPFREADTLDTLESLLT